MSCKIQSSFIENREYLTYNKRCLCPFTISERAIPVHYPPCPIGFSVAAMRFSDLTYLEEGIFRVRAGFMPVNSQCVETYVIEFSIIETERCLFTDLKDDAEVQSVDSPGCFHCWLEVCRLPASLQNPLTLWIGPEGVVKDQVLSQDNEQNRLAQRLKVSFLENPMPQYSISAHHVELVKKLAIGEVILIQTLEAGLTRLW